MNKKEFSMSEKQIRIFKAIYYIFFSWMTVITFIQTTKFDISKYDMAIHMITALVGILVVTKIALEWKEYWSYKEIIIAIICVGCLVASDLHIHRDNMFAYCILIMGARNIDSKKLIRLFSIISGILLIFTIGMCLAGKVANLTVYRDVNSTRPRMALGFNYVTWLSAHILSVSATWLYWRGTKISWLETAIMAIAASVGYYVCDGRISAFVNIIIVVAIAIVKLFDKNGKVRGFVSKKVMSICLCFSSVILALISIILAIICKIGTPFWNKMDALASKRLYSNAIAFIRYPQTLLGQQIVGIGGYKSGTVGLEKNYFVINNSYIKILLGWGILTFVGLMLAWVLLTYRELLSNHIIEAFIFVSYSLEFFFQHRIVEFSFNPFFVLLLCGSTVSFFKDPNVNLIKKANNIIKKSKSVLTIFIIAFAIEGCVFNYGSIQTLFNEEIGINDVVVLSDDCENNENSLIDSKDKIDIKYGSIYTYTGLESITYDFAVFTQGDNNEYRLVKDAEYDVDLYIPTEDGMEYVDTYRLKSGHKPSSYIEYKYPGMVQMVQLVAHFPENTQIAPIDIGFNGPKPFNMNYLRVLIMGLVMCLVYYMFKNNKDKKKALFELSYYIYFSIALFLQFMDTTVISIAKYRTVLKFGLLFFGIILIIKIIYEWKDAWNIKSIIIGLVCVGLIMCSLLNYIDGLFVVFCLCILGARNISSKRILTLYVVLISALTLFVVTYCLTGHAENFVVYRDAYSSHKRQALGFMYTTFLSAHIMGICSVWSYIRGKLISWIEIVSIALLGFLTYYLTEGRITCGVIVAISIIMATAKILNKRNVSVSCNKFIEWLLVLSVDLIAVFAIVMGAIYQYGSPLFNLLNKLSSERLYFNALTFDRYDLSMWGQRVVFVGGYAQEQRGIVSNYYMINCSYINVLFKRGVLGLLALLVGWTLLSYREAKKKEYYKLLILSTLSTYFFFEDRMFVSSVIPFWILLLSDKEIIFFDVCKCRIINILTRFKRKIYLILSMAALSFAVEFAIFNYSSVLNMLNEKIDILTTTRAFYGIKEVVDNKLIIDRESMDENDEAYIYISDIYSPKGIKSFEFGLNFSELTDSGNYRYVDNVKYSYDIVSEEDGLFYKIATVNCDSSKPITWYTKLNEDALVNAFYIIPHIEGDYMFDVMRIDFNGPTPYDFNPGRLALIWLILSVIAIVIPTGKKPEAEKV